VKVIRAESAGFCWGVERAIDIAREYAGKGKYPVYTDGPLIHNKQMMEKLETEGIREVGDYQSKSELAIEEEEKGDSVMVVRAHGISPERRKYLKTLDLEFRDATCPDVGIIAGKIRLHTKKGYNTVIFGDPEHPEAIGLVGYTEGKGHVVQTKEDIDNLPPLGEKVIMVSQSTMFTHEFVELSARLKEKYTHLLVFDTIWATKNLLSALNNEECSNIMFGIHRENNEGRKILVPTSYSRISNLVDLRSEKCEKFNDIANLAVTEIIEIFTPETE